MTDLPLHEGVIALLRSRGDVSRFPPGLYVLNLGHPNQLFQLLAWPLTFAVSPTLATRLVAALATAAVPLGASRLSRHLGANPAVSLMAVPIALGWTFNWGLVNNLLGLGLLLACLPALDRFVSRPTARHFAVVLAATLVLYLAHEAMLFVFIGACGLFTLLSPTRLRASVLRLAPAAVGLAIAATHVMLQRHLMSPTVRAVPDAYSSLLTKLVEIPVVLVGSPAALPKYAVAGLWLAGAALFTAARSRPVPQAAASLRARLSVFRFELLSGAVFVLYLVAPFSFLGATLVYERFLAPAALIGLIGLAPRRAAQATARPGATSRWHALAVILAGAVSVATVLVVLPDFVESSINYNALEHLLCRIPGGSAVAAVELDADDEGRTFSAITSLSRVLARSGGRVMYSFTDSPVAPVRVAPRFQWNEPALRLMNDSLWFCPAHDFTRFRFLLLHSRRAYDMKVADEALLPYATPIASDGEWALLESRLDVVPLTAPDVPLPTPAPSTLRALGRQILDARAATNPGVLLDPPSSATNGR